MKHTIDSQHEDAAKLFRILGHPMRLSIIEALHVRPWCVCELAGQLGLNKSVTSKHLSSLKSVGIIDMRREGTQVNCVLTMPCVLDMMHCIIDPPFAKEESFLRNKESLIMDKKRIMFVCIHNSARSQMCEAFVRHHANDRFEVSSSGIEAGKLNPLVVQAMAEIGISMDGHYAKPAKEFIDRGEAFDYVVTVCDESNAERCPMFPGKHERLHWGFPDPSDLSGSVDEKLKAIRPIRDAIQKRVTDWLAGN
ncbi:MAG: metalloregulator ArsR/SmtB family transcription factor [Sphaerochaeta sp.]|nr:metalloregulator ArsR/SmtB family transcription factor [Sphaerochaeta sp.]